MCVSLRRVSSTRPRGAEGSGGDHDDDGGPESNFLVHFTHHAARSRRIAESTGYSPLSPSRTLLSWVEECRGIFKLRAEE